MLLHDHVVFCEDLVHLIIYFTLSQDGLTPLMRASYRGNTECVAVLLDRGAQANQKDKVRVLCSVSLIRTVLFDCAQWYNLFSCRSAPH